MVEDQKETGILNTTGSCTLNLKETEVTLTGIAGYVPEES